MPVYSATQYENERLCKELAVLYARNFNSDDPMPPDNLMELAGYAPEDFDKYKRITASDEFRQNLIACGFTEDSAKGVVQEIMLDKAQDATARLKATDQVFKVHGTYAPEKRVITQIQPSDETKSLVMNVLNVYLQNKDKKRIIHGTDTTIDEWDN